MNSINFNLKKAKGNKESLIYLIFRYGKNRLKYSTGKKIYPSEWNFKKQRPKQLDNSLIELNKNLTKIEKQARTIYLAYENKNEHLSIESFKEELNKALKTKLQNDNSFFSYFECYIETSKQKKSSNTTKGYVTVLNTLKLFADTLPSKSIDFEDIDLKFYDKFEAWFNSKGYTLNYFGKIITVLKTVLKQAFKEKVYKTSEPIYLDDDFKAPSMDVDKIYLNIDELGKMSELDLSNNKKLERVRDLFLVASFTGVRYSDLSKLQTENIKTLKDSRTKKEIEIISITTEKTDNPVAIPLHPIVKSILKKYNEEFPKIISNQKFNKYLKEVAEKAELKDKITVTKKVGNMKFTTSTEKYKLVTVHTSRRSFVSNAREFGIDADDIMSIVGHRSAKMFLKYQKQSPEQKALRAFKSEFYNKSIIKIAR